MLLCILLCTVHLRISNVSPCQLLVNILWIRIFDTTCIFCFNYTNFNLWGYYLKYLCMVIYLYFRWNVWCAAINGSIQFRNAHESRCNGMCLMQWATVCLTFFCNKLRFSLDFFWLMNLYHIKMCYLFFKNIYMKLYCMTLLCWMLHKWLHFPLIPISILKFFTGFKRGISRWNSHQEGFW